MVQTESEFKTEFAVEMTCESCVSDVKNVLEGAQGISKYNIDLKEQRVVVEGSGKVIIYAWSRTDDHGAVLR
ncbi:hypothetical protein EDD21DRAFT_421351 [Dissophora ornata]|nr:hypothetical protein EDD21DRAFT_421351 [Dissophora ornata]